MYLHYTRLAFFQLTSALCITVVGLASWGLKFGLDKEAFVSKSIPGAHLNIKDALGAGGAVTAASGVASLLCLGMSILSLFYRHRPETLTTVRVKEGVFAFACVLWLATLIPATIIMRTHSGVVSKPGVPAAVIAQIVKLSGQDLAYRTQTPIKSYVSVGWVAFVSTFINLVLVSITARHVHKYGPDTEHGALAPPHHHTDSQPRGTGSFEKHDTPEHGAQDQASTDAEKATPV